MTTQGLSERSDMQYEVFRSAVFEVLNEDKDWSVHAEWQEEVPPVLSCGERSARGTGAADDDSGLNEDFIELEQEKGPFYEFMTISLSRLYFSYMEEGWDATVRTLEKYTRRGSHGVRRTRGIDYEARLNEEGVALYGRLRELRSRIAAQKQLPPYFIFMNRSLYEMCCRQPATMDALQGIYGVGEKNSVEYGEAFLDEIRKFTGGVKRQLAKLPGGTAE